jgi:hypothetical protein
MRGALRDDGPTPETRDWITRRIPEWLRFHISVNDFPLGVFLARRAAKGITGRSASENGGRRPS